MNSTKIELAGMLFKVWYDKHSYEVYEVKKYNPHGDWVELRKSIEDHLKDNYLSPTVLIAAEGRANALTLEIGEQT